MAGVYRRRRPVLRKRRWIGTVAAVAITGTSAQTLGAFTSTASGTETFTGTSAQTLGAFTSTASGTETITGTSAQTLAAFTSTASGTETITGTSAQTLGSFTSSASGVVANSVTGTSAQTLGAFTSTASGSVGTVITGTVAATLGAFTSTATAAIGSFPSTISGNSRYILDHGADAWPCIGDAGWTAMVNLAESDQDLYLETIATLGYNATLCTLVEGHYSAAPLDNQYGDDPFSGAAYQTSLNEAYWVRVDRYFTKAASLGITILAFPTYIGYSGDGVFDELTAATNGQMTTFGATLGTRYKNYPNIIWVMGGDNSGPGGTVLARVAACADGIKSTDTRHLMTAHTDGDEVLSAEAVFGGYSWFDINTSYRITEATQVSMGATTHAESPTRPWFDIEGKYDGDDTRSPQATRQSLRVQAWTALCTGGNGHVFGNAPRWGFGYGYGGSGTWQQSLGFSTPGALDDATVEFGAVYGGFFDIFPNWYTTAPDTTDTFLTSGESTGAAQGAARFDGNRAVIYLPTSRSIDLDLTEMSGSWSAVRVRKMDPTTGTITTVGTYATSGTQTIGALGNNASVTYSDWVLLVEGTVDVTGTSAQTLGSFTSTASGTETFTGTSAQTLGSFTSTASGTETFTGTSAQTLAAFTSTASGTETFTGTSAQTLGSFTATASGVVAVSVTGTAAVTLGSFTAAAVGTGGITVPTTLVTLAWSVTTPDLAWSSPTSPTLEWSSDG